MMMMTKPRIMSCWKTQAYTSRHRKRRPSLLRHRRGGSEEQPSSIESHRREKARGLEEQRELKKATVTFITVTLLANPPPRVHKPRFRKKGTFASTTETA